MREDGILIIGSGNLVHNLHAYALGRHMPDPYDWAVRFERDAKEAMVAGEYKPLIEYESLGPEALLSIPTQDHYSPMLYVIATRQQGEIVTFPVESVDDGSISMLTVGSPLLKEALDRRHTVTAIVRHPEKVEKREGLIAKAGDVYDTASLVTLVRGNNAFMSAFNPGWQNPNLYDDQVRGTASIIAAMKNARIKRVLWVGGAGGLQVKPGVRFIDGPDMPLWARPRFSGHHQCFRPIAERSQNLTGPI